MTVVLQTRCCGLPGNLAAKRRPGGSERTVTRRGPGGAPRRVTGLAGSTTGRAPAMTRLPRLLGRSALAGAATGSRSLTAAAALALSASPAAKAQPDRTLANPKVKLAASALAASEWVTDKLPITPSRLKPAGLVPRLAGAAACGVVIARRDLAGLDGAPPAGDGPPPAGDGAPPATVVAACALTATAAAGGAAWLGARWRQAGTQWLGHDWIAALIEDSVAASLAATAAWTA